MKGTKLLDIDHLTAVTLRSRRVGLSKEDIQTSFLEHLFFGSGHLPQAATMQDIYFALSLTIRDRVFKEFLTTTRKITDRDARVVAYLSAEYLPGPHLAKNILGLGVIEQTRAAMQELGIDLDTVIAQEEEPGLGNGGLGRLASCYLDSMATLGIPSIAYGIRYEFGIFDQVIEHGWQVEYTDDWLHNGNPWEVERPEIVHKVGYGGRTYHSIDRKGRHKVEWVPDTEMIGTAYDTPILGYSGNGIVMRLWKAGARNSFDFAAYNLGEYHRAVDDKIRSENITKVLYPNDQELAGKELRLKQQYFFVTCALQDLLRLHRRQGRSLENLDEKFAIQLNDTHPAIAIAEWMRLLVDVHGMEWGKAWNITRNTFAYTNHTLLPEALEKWGVHLFERVLPRHMEIIYEINHQFIQELREKHGCSDERIARMSLIDDHGERSVRMAHLATIGSRMVNGVSALHSRLLRDHVFNDFSALWPEKYVNVTNGISSRRFLAVSNPGLANLITGRIGDAWLLDLDALRGLEPLADDLAFQKEWRAVKLKNKERLARVIEEKTGVVVPPNMLFDIQVKRIHEYKRQLLMVLHIITAYLRHKKGEAEEMAPTVFIFSGKAAPGYFKAKLIIKLINSVADMVNSDRDLHEKMKVVFLPDFNVKNAQNIYPAADLSEQISMAGMEASGTGNMKFCLNGAITIGTLDGANVEIREEVGEENFFLFGHTTEEVQAVKAKGYRPRDLYENDRELQTVLDLLVSKKLTHGDTELFRPILDDLLQQDKFLVLADYRAYLGCQEEVHLAWRDQAVWTRRSILNAARMGKFSSDRSVQEYADLIWKVGSVREK